MSFQHVTIPATAATASPAIASHIDVLKDAVLGNGVGLASPVTFVVDATIDLDDVNRLVSVADPHERTAEFLNRQRYRVVADTTAGAQALSENVKSLCTSLLHKWSTHLGVPVARIEVHINPDLSPIIKVVATALFTETDNSFDHTACCPTTPRSSHTPPKPSTFTYPTGTPARKKSLITRLLFKH